MATCRCKSEKPHSLRVMVCARGFLIVEGGDYGEIGVQYAFDDIQDAASWMVDRLKPESAK